MWMLILLVSVVSVWKVESILRPNFGVGFKQIGFVHPSTDRHYITLAFEIPRFVGIGKQYLFNCPTTVEKYGCVNYRRLVYQQQEFERRKIQRLKRKIKDIWEILPEEGVHSTHSMRPKRFLPVLPLISGIAGIAGWVNGFLMRRKISANRYAIQELRKEGFEVNTRVLKVHNELIHLAKISTEVFADIEHRLNNTDTRFQVFMRTYQRIITSIQDEQKENVEVQSVIIAELIGMIERSRSYYNEMLNIVTDFERGMVEVMKGKLPSGMISPSEFNKILQNAEKELYEQLPEYTLVFPQVRHYYHQIDLIYQMVDGHLVVTLPLLIRKRNSLPMKLYRIQTCYVPYEISHESKPRAYTKVKLDVSHIAVRDTLFIELSDGQMESCTQFDETFVCDSVMLQTHQGMQTCSSVIFWNEELESVRKVCDFEYMEGIKPIAQVLESSEHLLLANLDMPWTFQCQENYVPRRNEGATYAIIERQSMCQCSMVSKNYFIAQSLCRANIKKVKLLYPINAAVAIVFSDKIDKLKATEISRLYEEPVEMRAPNLSEYLPYSSPKHQAVIKDLEQLVERLENGKVSEGNPIKGDKQSEFVSWWTQGRKVMYAVTFTLAIIGCMAGIFAVYNCIKTRKLSAMMGGVLGVGTLQGASASDVASQTCNSIGLSAVDVSIVVGIYLGFLLIRHWYRKSTMVKVIIPNAATTKNGDTCHFYIEIGTGIKLERFYAFSVGASPLGLRFSGTIPYASLNYTSKFGYGTLSMPWRDSTFSVKCNNLKLKLPELAYVAPLRIKSLKKILAAAHYIRVIMVHGEFSYPVPNADMHLISPRIE